MNDNAKKIIAKKIKYIRTKYKNSNDTMLNIDRSRNILLENEINKSLKY